MSPGEHVCMHAMPAIAQFASTGTVHVITVTVWYAHYPPALYIVHVELAHIRITLDRNEIIMGTGLVPFYSFH